MDERYRLPVPESQAPPTKPEGGPVGGESRPAGPVEDRVWGGADMDRWLADRRLASWVGPWALHLAERFGEALPAAWQQALDGSDDSDDLPRWLRKGSPEPAWLVSYLGRSDLAATWLESGYFRDDPPWLDQLLRYEEAKVARSFLLTGNVNDYAFDPVLGYRPAVRLLTDALCRVKDCVLSYRLSQGLTFHSLDPANRAKLPDEICELLDQKDPFRDDIPLSTQLCYLFDTLRRWLSGHVENVGETEDEVGADSADAFPRGVGLVFENVHLLIPAERNDPERNYLVDNLLLWSISPELFRSSHCLILTADSLEDVGDELRAQGGKIEQIALPRPRRAEERLKFLMPILDPSSHMNETRAAQMPRGSDWLTGYCEGNYLERLRRLSHDTAGLTYLGIEDLLQQASLSPGGRLRRHEVMSLKKERLRQDSGGLLEVVEPRLGLDDIGGYRLLKQRLRQVIGALERADDPLIRSTIPMGILFAGPPGTGKSVVAEALAGASGISLAKLGDFRGMYVGQSERNLSLILGLIEALHPVIVFVDEIDQAFGKRDAGSGDGGVDRRVFGRILEFMSDTEHRGRILWIGASNHPTNLDPAMKRAGRFDLILPFTLPGRSGRAEIFRRLMARKLRGIDQVESQLTGDDFGHLADRTEGFSGAEIEAVLGEVLRRLVERRPDGAGQTRVERADVDRVLDLYRPAPGVRKDYRAMEEEAIAEVSFLDLLPQPETATDG